MTSTTVEGTGTSSFRFWGIDLDRCAEKNEEPEKPFDEGQVVRMSSALHRMIALAARNENKSINTWIAEARKKPRDNKD